MHARARARIRTAKRFRRVVAASGGERRLVAKKATALDPAAVVAVLILIVAAVARAGAGARARPLYSRSSHASTLHTGAATTLKLIARCPKSSSARARARERASDGHS